jgi:RHS repeat-associated protein
MAARRWLRALTAVTVLAQLLSPATPPPVSAAPLAQTGGTLNGFAAFEDRAQGSSGYVNSLTITLSPTGPGSTISVTRTTDAVGAFTVDNVPPGVYDVEIKMPISISRKALGLSFSVGAVTTHGFGSLLGGDGDNSNQVTAADFTVLKQSFTQLTSCAAAPTTPPCADFDASGQVSPNDFSILKRNFLQQGPLAASTNPLDQAPPVDQSVATQLCSATQFLYSGGSAVQTGVAPNTIQCAQVAVLRGQVTNLGGGPLAGVAVSILDHPEFGQTLTRSDGAYDLVVNGGISRTLSFTKSGFPPAQRTVTPPQQDYTVLPDVVMVAYDPQVTVVQTGSVSSQVAQGSSVTDTSGMRRATLIFPSGTTAIADGPGQAPARTLSTMSMRATEFSVGPNGENAMPGELPPTSGYTYAVEYSVDEAPGANIQFNQPVPTYVDNFLNLPVGSIVPAGYYDRALGKWVPAPNGRIINLVSESGGMANLDTDGVGGANPQTPDLDALGITPEERTRLAELYDAPKSLWRVPVSHFTPWDYNYPKGAPPGSIPPQQPAPDPQTVNDPCKKKGSSIECQNQTLGQALGMQGTPFRLHYESDRVPGRLDLYKARIPVTPAIVPASMIKVLLTITVAGRKTPLTLGTQPNQVYEFTWDGKDAYGRLVQGAQPISASICYVYPAVYLTPSQFAESFAALAGSTVSLGNARTEVNSCQSWSGTIGTFDARALNLGGWSLSHHHWYDPVGRNLYLGDGQHVSAAAAVTSVIKTVAGGNDTCPDELCDGGPATDAKFATPQDIAFAPDGTYYITDFVHNRVRKVNPNGIITTVAGDGLCNGPGGTSDIGDNGPAATAHLCRPWGIHYAPDGSLYVGDQQHHRIRRIAPNGFIATVAGNGTQNCNIPGCTQGDGGPATQANLNSPFGAIVGTDGSLYISDTGHSKVRRVAPNGIITTFVGTGISGPGGDGILATQTSLSGPEQLAFAPDGSLYIAECTAYKVRRVGTNGIITTVAGNGQPGFSGDGGPATAAEFFSPCGVAFGPDGSYYLSDYQNGRLRAVGPDGVVSTIAGGGSCGGAPCGDGGPATQAQMVETPRSIVGPDRSIYIVDQGGRIRRLGPVLPGLATTDLLIPSTDGSEVYVFNSSGRHLRTVHGLTGATLFTFTYDSAGRLAQVVDGDGLITAIQRDATGRPTGILSPGGQLTTLAVNGNGYLSQVTASGGTQVQAAYTSGGLMTSLTDPRGNPHTFTYNALGRLIKDQNPAGGFTDLVRTDLTDGFQVATTTAMGRTTIYKVQNLGSGNQLRTNTDSAGLVTTESIQTDGTRITTFPDGTVMTAVMGPDPRFGMLVPLQTQLTVTTLTGPTSTQTATRSAMLSDPTNPMSLVSISDTSVVNGRTSTAVYTASNRTSVMTSPAGRQRTTRIDLQGRVVEDAVPGLANVTFTYDGRGRLSQTAQGGRVTTYGYDGADRLVSITDPLSRVSTYGYDAAGNITQQVLPGARTITSTFDAAGNRLTLAPPDRPVHGFTYNSVDLTSQYAPPNVGAGTNNTGFTFNLDQQLTQLSRPDGNNVALAYDSAGRVQTLTEPRGATTWGYSPTRGTISSVNAPGGVNLTYTYQASLPTGSTLAGPVAGSTNQTYDNDYRRAATSVNGTQAAAYTYDADGLLTAAGAMSLTRHPQLGLISGTTLGSVTTTQTFNTFGEVLNRNTSFSGNPLLSLQYTRDGAGRITQRAETIQGVPHSFGFSYDTAGRLSAVTQDGNPVASYTYDGNGNRLTRVTPGGTTTGTYDNQDRLTQYGNTTFAYTANGELLSRTTSGQTTTYSYDTQGNLISATLPDTTQVSYVIDGLNRRVGKRVGGTLVQGFLYEDQLRPIAELDGSNNVVSRFVYASHRNVPDYLVKGGVTYRILTDHLGSVRLVVNTSDGSIAQRMDFDEFGNVVGDSSAGFQPFGFAGGLYDQHTRLLRFGARDYDPQTGRWTAKDSIGFASGVTNLYVYASNDPVNTLDVTGFDEEIYNMSEAEFQAILQERLIKIEQLLKKGKSIAEAAGGFDSSILNHPVYGQNHKICFRGRILTGGELNYYFQGRIWHAFGYSRAAMKAAIYGWKATSYGQLPTDNVLWAADIGYDDDERAHPHGLALDAVNLGLDITPLTWLVRSVQWGGK